MLSNKYYPWWRNAGQPVNNPGVVLATTTMGQPIDKTTVLINYKERRSHHLVSCLNKPQLTWSLHVVKFIFSQIKVRALKRRLCYSPRDRFRRRHRQRGPRLLPAGRLHQQRRQPGQQLVLRGITEHVRHPVREVVQCHRREQT